MWEGAGRRDLANSATVQVANASTDLACLVRRAAAGEQSAWDALVDRYSSMLWSIARSCGLGRADAADVCQTSWLRLVEHLRDLEHPERVGSWLATTTRREAVRVSATRAHLVLTSDDGPFDERNYQRPPEISIIVDHHFTAEVASALGALPERSRTLLVLLMCDPPLPYAEIAQVMDIPIGSIGPTRARVMASVRAVLERRGISADDLGSV